MDYNELATDDARCPACGSPIDYCRGHGDIGDPVGRAILDAHDDGDHTGCHPDGCEDAPRRCAIISCSYVAHDADDDAEHFSNVHTVHTDR